MAKMEAPTWITLITRRGTPLLFQYPISVAAKEHFPDLYGLDIKFRNYAYRFPDGAILADLRELGSATGVIKQKIDEGSWSIFIDPVYRQAEKVLSITKQISKLNPKSLDNAALADWFQKYMAELEIYDAVLPGAPIVTIVLAEKISGQLKAILEGRGGAGQLESYLETLIFPTRRSPIEQATRNVLALVARIQADADLRSLFLMPMGEVLSRLPQHYSDFFSQVEAYVAQFAYINTDLWLGDPLTIKDLVAELKTFVELRDASQSLAKMDQNEAGRQKLAERIVQELEISDDLLKLIEFSREQFALKQYMRSVVLIAGLDVRGFVTEIGHRVGFDYKELMYFTPPEIVEALAGKGPTAGDISQRVAGGYGLYLLDGQLKLLVGEELAKEIPVAMAAGAIEELAGAVVYPGKYEGPVSVIYTREGIDQMEKGDVLVAPMTDPYLLPALLKAGAIVTDEGGLLSHAAIVSRELRIPCIVGTERATKVLQNHDQVQVDAMGSQGNVRLMQHGRTQS